MKAHISLPKEKIAGYCHRWGIARLALFGSVIRDDFRPDSDVDVLVTFQPDTRHTLFDMARMQTELQQILGRDVDLVSRRGIENSRNHLRRKAILESAEVIYEQ